MKMPIVIYSKVNCSYCTKAKNLLNKLGLDYTEKKLEDFESTESFLKDIGKNVRAMPQIKIDGELIGGCDIAIELHNNGELESLFKSLG